MAMTPGNEALELWGGLECTTVRIRDQFRNELADTGHIGRIEDLDAIAGLGIRTLRYPVLWEAVAPHHPDECDWRWSDERLARMRRLEMRPVAGLVHHGSGPRYTDLLDRHFPALLAGHAERVARRYPWIEMFTPVNEPLTTARFSGLYGHWYPHGRDQATFLRALVTECTATVLAMRAIRGVRPDAKLVQTEDLGKTFSTPLLSHQADLENERRWLSLDLLCGRVDPHHPWHEILVRNGIRQEELELFLEADAAPDIIGINHYLTSERFLDERLHRYPEWSHGGNEVQGYADVEAVRMDLPAWTLGPKARVAEAWERYGRPIVVTEAHHGSTRDEQVRWLMEVWWAAEELRAAGQDIRAVTVWSLFGAVDWNSLLVNRSGYYEAGAFDIRGARPRRTAIGTAAASLATTGAFDHPVLDRQGWWQREGRFYHPPKSAGPPRRPFARRILITGATGTLGRGFARICVSRGLDHVVLSRTQMDIADVSSVAAAIDRYRPWAVVNAAGYVRVDEAHREREACFRANAIGAEVLARACADAGLPVVTFSSDRVFDGQLGRPYVEQDPLSPACLYGESKAEAERRVSGAYPDALIVRTSAFFSPWDRRNFIYNALRDMAAGHPVRGASRAVVSPTYVPDLAHAVLDLLVDGETGVWHLTNTGATSWHDLATRIAHQVGLSFAPPSGQEDTTIPIRALATARGVTLPPLEDGLSRYFAEREVDWSEPEYLIAAAPS
jgi:dTDP-4-dehydrorhamnose reductase